MPFNNPIVGGIILRIPAIQSPNYVSGVSGWSINRDGTVEFNFGTFRGGVLLGSAPTGPGLSINNSLPAILTTRYVGGGIMSSITAASILMYAATGIYVYQVTGIDSLGNQLYARGYVSGSSIIEEFLGRSNLGSGGTGLQAFASYANSQNTAYQFGNHTGNLGISNFSTMDLFNTVMSIGQATNDNGALLCNVQATFKNTTTVGNGATFATNGPVSLSAAGLNTHVFGKFFVDQDTTLSGNVSVAGNLPVAGIATSDNIRSGVTSITPVVSGAVWKATKTVTWPNMIGTYSSFTLVATPHTGVPEFVSCGVGAIASGGGNITLTRTDGPTATSVSWTAMGNV